jgi:hypothetical protein
MPSRPGLHLFAFSLSVLLLLPGCDEEVLGPTRRGSIEGRVLAFDTSAPIPGASVTTSPATGAFVTDANGAFTLSDIESGSYNLSARKTGFSPNTLAVAVRDGETTPATLFLERDPNATARDSVAAEIVNWANRVVNTDTTFVDVEYRVRNAGTIDVAAYEVYIRIDTGGDSFFQEVQGDSLPTAQVDVGTFSKFLRDESATTVTIDDLWFTTGTTN